MNKSIQRYDMNIIFNQISDKFLDAGYRKLVDKVRQYYSTIGKGNGWE